MTSIYCHRCRKITLWEDMRGGRERCTGCADVFPCRAPCDHIDCVPRKEELLEEKERRRAAQVLELEALRRSESATSSSAVCGPGFTRHTSGRLRSMRARIESLERRLA